jgi:uncharacterized protein (TIGR03084 family)
MTLLDTLLADLAQLGDHLRAAVVQLPEEGWRTPTPAAGWDVATQIAHLAWTDEAATLACDAAAGDAAGWDELVLKAIADPEGVIDAEALAIGRSAPHELLARWDTSRTAVATALWKTSGKLPWFGPPMSPTSMATARLMETWAHGLDVYDGLGLTAPRTDAVRHVSHLGVRTLGYSFANNGLEPPAEEIQVTLVLPSDEVVTFGPDEAPQTVTGSAWDFARLVTQRVHRDDTDLVATGADAEQWLRIAQAFAGPAGAGRDAR